MRDALKSKSQWWRKCPLEISHGTREILHSETAVELFAEGSAAKEQWYVALKTACGQASKVESLKDSYAKFCASVKSDLHGIASCGVGGGYRVCSGSPRNLL